MINFMDNVRQMQETEEVIVLANFLNMSVLDIQMWSDESLTINGNSDSVEYYVSEEENNNFAKLLGTYDGWFIYKN